MHSSIQLFHSLTLLIFLVSCFHPSTSQLARTTRTRQGTQVWVPSGERGSTDWVFAEVVDDVEEGAKEALVALEDDTGRVIPVQDPDTGEYQVRALSRVCGVCGVCGVRAVCAV